MRVELANRPGVFVSVNAEDYDRMIANGIKPRWVLNEAFPGFFYVRCYQPDVAGKLGLVARHVLQAGRGRQVKYVNGDRLDLRRRNLMLATAGWATGQTPVSDEFVSTTAPRPTIPTRAKPTRVILGSSAGQDMRPDGGMGSPEATSGFAFAGA